MSGAIAGERRTRLPPARGKQIRPQLVSCHSRLPDPGCVTQGPPTQFSEDTIGLETTVFHPIKVIRLTDGLGTCQRTSAIA